GANPNPARSRCWAGRRSRCGSGRRIDLTPKALGVRVAVTPHTKHGETSARNHPNEAQRVVAGESAPEIGADRCDDQQCGAVEHDLLARVPCPDLPPALAPHQEDEE